MSRETIESIVRWQNTFCEKDALEITFHGGEPLVPGISFYNMALPLLREGLAPRKVHFSIQSNLWMLTDDLCKLFREYKVSIGTSLDGPQQINDAQRGSGYFERTMAGIKRARENGIDVGVICTFTSQSVSHTEEIFDYFVREGLNFTIHGAIPSLQNTMAKEWVLSPEVQGKLLVDMLNRYLNNIDKVRISTLDSVCKSISAGHGGICTFEDCLGGYLAVGPDGEIYPCQRFAGMHEYRLGNVHDCSSLEVISASLVWCMFRDREKRISEECAGCAYIDFCRGGCPYNVLAANGDGGSFGKTLQDPYCSAYKRIFSHIMDRAMEEVFSEENLAEVVNNLDPEKGLLQRGRLLSIMRGPHPYDTARHARRIIAAVAIASSCSPYEAIQKLSRLGLVTNFERTETAMCALHERLTSPVRGLNKLYLHVTFACNLQCTHCYAKAGLPRKGTLSVEDTINACHEAAKLGFRYAVITGGEPLVHPQRDELLNGLADMRKQVKPLLTVLRTNLAVQADSELLRRIAYSTDKVVVSVDGDRRTHDERRGAGSYDMTLHNLRALVDMGYDTNISLATVLPLRLASGAPGEAVRALAKELGIRRIRFRPLLPLGRAVDSEPDIVPETIWGHMDPHEMLIFGFNPSASCGMGQNLYVEPDGSAYPCYAWCSEKWCVGFINRDEGLTGIVKSAAFLELGKHTVNTNLGCRKCTLRYLCGGTCRAWNRQNEQTQNDLDAPPADCTKLHKRARSLLKSAMERMKITPERWFDAGLPLSDEPPNMNSKP